MLSDEMLPASPAKNSQTVDEQAAEILRSHGLFSIPVDPVILANQHGIKIFNAKFSTDGLSGMIARRNGSTTILIRGNEPPFRKRFTIAHELGHHFLHLMEDGEFVDNSVDLFRDNEADGGHGHEKEVEANRFAAALLMPAQLVREYHASGKRSPAELARIFNVSEEAMAIRLLRLRLA